MKKTKYRCIYRRDNADGTRVYYIRPTIQGRRTWRKAGYTLSKALEFYRQYQQIKGFTDLGFQIPERVKFRRLSELYVEDYERRRGPGNLPRILSVFRNLDKCFGDTNISDINSLAIDKTNLPRQELIYLRAALRKAKRWEYIFEVPEFDIPQTPEKLGRRISLEELSLILKQASPDHRDAILLCLYLGGCRLGELCKITRDNTDFERGIISLDQRKAGVPKRFVITKEAERILKRRFIMNGGTAFKEKPKKLSQKFLYDRQRIKGIKPWRFHDLRHTAPTIFEEQGIDRDMINKLLGHKTRRMTERYLHPTEAGERRALELLEEIINGITGL